jgi:hypothetical protein
MAADVVFTAEDPWYTSSQSWYGIAGFAMSGLAAPAREQYRQHVIAPLGTGFTSLPDDKSAGVARWLSGATGRMLAAGTPDGGRSRAHLRELARRRQSEIQLREPGGSARNQRA